MEKNKQSGIVRKIWVPLTWLVLAALMLSGCAGAPPAKVYHVGILSGLDAFAPAVDSFKAQMT